MLFHIFCTVHSNTYISLMVLSSNHLQTSGYNKNLFNEKKDRSSYKVGLASYSHSQWHILLYFCRAHLARNTKTFELRNIIHWRAFSTIQHYNFSESDKTFIHKNSYDKSSYEYMMMIIHMKDFVYFRTNKYWDNIWCR